MKLEKFLQENYNYNPDDCCNLRKTRIDKDT